MCQYIGTPRILIIILEVYFEEMRPNYKYKSAINLLHVLIIMIMIFISIIIKIIIIYNYCIYHTNNYFVCKESYYFCYYFYYYKYK